MPRKRRLSFESLINGVNFHVNVKMCDGRFLATNKTCILRLFTKKYQHLSQKAVPLCENCDKLRQSKGIIIK